MVPVLRDQSFATIILLALYSKVIYDRENSAIAVAEPSEFDWDTIFEGAEWFHFTGITPALSQNMADACLTACKKAKEKGLTISCDLNYRKKLWSNIRTSRRRAEELQEQPGNGPRQNRRGDEEFKLEMSILNTDRFARKPFVF